jgi:hypothetical protein
MRYPSNLDLVKVTRKVDNTILNLENMLVGESGETNTWKLFGFYRTNRVSN